MSEISWTFVAFLAATASLTVAYLIFWVRNFAETKVFMRAGLTFVGIFLLIEVVMLSAQAIIGERESSLRLVVAFDSVLAVRVYVFTVVGLLFAARLNDHYSRFVPAVGQAPTVTAYGLPALTGKAVGYSLIVTAFMLVFSTGLFWITSPQLSPGTGDADSILDGVSPLVFLVFSAAAFGEEIVFRFGMQNALTYLWRWSRFGHHWAVLVTAAVWTMGHVGALEPDWVKFVQVFTFGVILGQMNRRLGIVPCIIAHVLFNVVMAHISIWLIGEGVLRVPATP